MRSQALLTASLLAIILMVSSGHGATVVDTSRTHEPVAPHQSTTIKLLSAPALILKLPLKLVKGMTKTGMKLALANTAPTLFILKVFGTNKPLHPLLWYGSKSGLEGGIGLRLRNLVGDDDQLRIRARWSVKEYRKYNLSYRSGFSDNAHTTLSFRTNYYWKPRESFHGLGNNSLESDDFSVTHEQGLVEIAISHRPSHKLTTEFIGQYSSMNIYDGQDLDHLHDLATIADTRYLASYSIQRSRFAILSGGFVFDWRDQVGQPSHGGTESATVMYAVGTGASDGLTYWGARVDLWQYFHLFRRRTLAARLLVEAVDVLSDRQDLKLPYYRLPNLGGQESLRGYESHRFYARGLALASIEYRYPVWLGGDGFIFLDQGRVFDSFGPDLTFEHWKHSFGLGIRGWSRHGERFRLTLAKSREEIRLYFSLGQD